MSKNWNFDWILKSKKILKNGEVCDTLVTSGAWQRKKFRFIDNLFSELTKLWAFEVLFFGKKLKFWLWLNYESWNLKKIWKLI